MYVLSSKGNQSGTNDEDMLGRRLSTDSSIDGMELLEMARQSVCIANLASKNQLGIPQPLKSAPNISGEADTNPSEKVDMKASNDIGGETPTQARVPM